MLSFDRAACSPVAASLSVASVAEVLFFVPGGLRDHSWRVTADGQGGSFPSLLF